MCRSAVEQCAAPHPCHALHQLVVQLAVRHLQEALEQDARRDEVFCLETRAGKQKQQGIVSTQMHAGWSGHGELHMHGQNKRMCTARSAVSCSAVRQPPVQPGVLRGS